MATDHLSFVNDRLLGLNVCEDAYQEPAQEEPPLEYIEEPLDDDLIWGVAPFALLVYTAWTTTVSPQDEPPGEYLHSYHNDRKSAEVDAAYLENAGVEPWRLRIVENYDVPPWEKCRLPG